MNQKSEGENSTDISWNQFCYRCFHLGCLGDKITEILNAYLKEAGYLSILKKNYDIHQESLFLNNY